MGKLKQLINKQAVAKLGHQQLLANANQAYETLQNDSQAWENEMKERQEWDITLSDGLDEYD